MIVDHKKSSQPKPMDELDQDFQPKLSNEIDDGWIELMKAAKNIGLTTEEVRLYLVKHSNIL